MEVGVDARGRQSLAPAKDAPGNHALRRTERWQTYRGRPFRRDVRSIPNAYRPKNGSTNLWIKKYVTAPTNAEHGIVSTHAVTIRCPQIHRTLRTPRVVPTPRIDPVIACV